MQQPPHCTLPARSALGVDDVPVSIYDDVSRAGISLIHRRQFSVFGQDDMALTRVFFRLLQYLFLRLGDIHRQNDQPLVGELCRDGIDQLILTFAIWHQVVQN